MLRRLINALFLVGEMVARDEIGDRFDGVLDALSQLAMRPVEEDNKEAEANTSALMALGKIGHPSAIPAMRHVLTSPEWEDDENQWMAAEALGKIVGESFTEKDDPVQAARQWLMEHPHD